jgi:hypothetical protein
MPYAILEYYTFASSSQAAVQTQLKEAYAYSIGLNIRPEPNVVIKLQAESTLFPNGPQWAQDYRASVFESQVAWAF